MTGEPWHGTANGYDHHDCRCPACREAHRVVMAAWKAAARQREPYRHDNSTYNNYGCRCDTCKAAHQAVMRQYR